MTLKFLALAALMAGSPAMAEIRIVDAYARAASPAAKSGAAFMEIVNGGTEDDRLVGVASEAAARVQLHTHESAGEGVMKMRHVEEGFAVPAGGHHLLARGGDHVMMMGLTGPLEQGATVRLTLTFEKAGEVVVEVPVDNERAPEAMDHSKMGH
ncbi:copper chaperone PCu(A)C [Oceanicola sp. 502str15]|uniref:copper chaperone PCu(A)C n=1 Tax=Oceanicola sp. 502str15 TaxID=2696061 RepID=UPI00209482A2|nr:copper chaperone PCu(A)C [Oceanicola sp. 502str15]MCO6381321.1 copper chaperone PCu(A)C [Oceanicola sp. 502str15]